MVTDLEVGRQFDSSPLHDTPPMTLPSVVSHSGLTMEIQ
jgi:hypothetical protein